jgi:hypothetical protein
VRGRFRTQSVSYCLQHAIHIAHDFVIPEPQKPIVVVEQPSVARLISRTFSVLTTVDFEDQSFFTTDKIHYEIAYWLLPVELMAVDRPRAQSIP